MRLRDLGEWELLQRLAAFAPPGQFNDDAALLSEQSGRQLVVNTDVLVEGVHFSDATMGAVDLGWRAAAANLSDLAAMGCSSVVGLTVALVAPADTTWAWVEGVYQGLSAALNHYGGVVLGGDCSSGSERLLSITALGTWPRQGGAIRRGDGRPGDWLVSSGPHGLSRLGLALLLHQLEPSAAAQLSPGLQERSIQAHRRPQPRLDASDSSAPMPTLRPAMAGGWHRQQRWPGRSRAQHRRRQPVRCGAGARASCRLILSWPSCPKGRAGAWGAARILSWCLPSSPPGLQP